jgi:hypothetical protein
MQQRSLVGWKTVVYTESEDPEPDSSFDFKFSRHDNIDAPASPHTLLNTNLCYCKDVFSGCAWVTVRMDTLSMLDNHALFAQHTVQIAIKGINLKRSLVKHPPGKNMGGS